MARLSASRSVAALSNERPAAHGLHTPASARAATGLTQTTAPKREPTIVRPDARQIGCCHFNSQNNECYSSVGTSQCSGVRSGTYIDVVGNAVLGSVDIITADEIFVGPQATLYSNTAIQVTTGLEVCSHTRPSHHADPTPHAPTRSSLASRPSPGPDDRTSTHHAHHAIPRRPQLLPAAYVYTEGNIESLDWIDVLPVTALMASSITCSQLWVYPSGWGACAHAHAPPNAARACLRPSTARVWQSRRAETSPRAD